MNNSLYEIENYIGQNTNKEERIIRGLWSVDCFFNPANNGRVFDYKFIISQTVGQGCAYSSRYDYPREFFYPYMGKDFLECDCNDIAMKVSLFDSVFWNAMPPKNYVRLEQTGSSNEKLKWRTSIIVEEAKALLGGLKNKNVVNVGVVGDFLKAFQNEGAFVIGTDFDKEITGKKMFGSVDIIDGSKTIDIISKSDIAIVTGMTIATLTIDNIIKCCHDNNVKLIVFAETGANLAGYYINNGVDVYLSEHFPFYIFNGYSMIDVCYPSIS